jgi:23S rRNA (adenine2503-C2)-methyltransferase
MELLGKSKSELREMCAAMGEPAYRGGQIYHALYAERKFDVRQMTNLPAALRARLAAEATIRLPVVKQRFASSDGSVRYLFSLAEAVKTENGDLNAAGAEDTEKTGGARKHKALEAASVEAVFMPSDGRQTICVSTQAGCAVDCRFCLTALLGLIRNLTAGEILGQLLVALDEDRRAREAKSKDETAGLEPAATGNDARATQRDPVQTNVVLMGQGEPLLNFDKVMAGLTNSPGSRRPGDFAEACDAFNERDCAGD